MFLGQYGCATLCFNGCCGSLLQNGLNEIVDLLKQDVSTRGPSRSNVKSEGQEEEEVWD